MRWDSQEQPVSRVHEGWQAWPLVRPAGAAPQFPAFGACFQARLQPTQGPQPMSWLEDVLHGALARGTNVRATGQLPLVTGPPRPALRPASICSRRRRCRRRRRRCPTAAPAAPPTSLADRHPRGAQRLPRGLHPGLRLSAARAHGAALGARAPHHWTAAAGRRPRLLGQLVSWGMLLRRSPHEVVEVVGAHGGVLVALRCRLALAGCCDRGCCWLPIKQIGTQVTRLA